MNRTVLAVILIVVILAAVALVVYMATKGKQGKGGSYEAPAGEGGGSQQPGSGQMQEGPQKVPL